MVFFWEFFLGGSQGHVDHAACFCEILFLGHRYTKLGHICDPEAYSTQRHRVTLVTWVTWCFFWENFVSGSQGHVDHVVCFW